MNKINENYTHITCIDYSKHFSLFSPTIRSFRLVSFQFIGAFVIAEICGTVVNSENEKLIEK